MQQQEPSDQALLAQILNREEGALRTLYERYSALIFTLALRKLGDRGMAEEVLQDVFLRCWQQAHTYREESGAVSAWLFGIARNRAIDVRRSRMQQARERESTALPDGDVVPSAWQASSTPDESERVSLQLTMRSALAELTPAQRQAIALAYYGNLSQSEIARELGEPLGTVKSRMRAAMERLRQTLRPDLDATRMAGAHD